MKKGRGRKKEEEEEEEEEEWDDEWPPKKRRVVKWRKVKGNSPPPFPFSSSLFLPFFL